MKKPIKYKKTKKVIFKYSKFKSLINFIKRKGKVDYHIEIIFAQIGSGKSTDIAKRCYKELYRKKRRYKYIYTNIETNIPGVRTFDAREFASGKYVFPPGSLVLIDEIGLILDNRQWKKTSEELIEYFRLCRHHKNTLIVYSQHYDMEKRLKTMASKLHLMRKHGIFSVKRRISKILSVVTTQNENSADSQIIDTLRFDSIFGGIELTCIPFWTDLFDSFDTTGYDKPNIPYKNIVPLELAPSSTDSFGRDSETKI